MNPTAACLLAIDASAAPASVVLFDGGELLAGRELPGGNRRSQELFDTVATLLQDAGKTFADVDVFAVGRGPGNYTGLRVSLTAANGWALPGGKTVWTVDSGEALAAQMLDAAPEDERIVVWGDARRGSIWAGVFEKREKTVKMIEKWQLLPSEEREKRWNDAKWLENAVAPSAEWIGRLFLSGKASEALEPLYLNPAVASN